MHRLLMILMVLAFAITSLVAFAAPSPTLHQKTAKVAKSSLYACDKCEAAFTKKMDKCPGCGGPVVAIKGTVMYMCETCKTTSKKPGNCPKCKQPMTEMAMTYACDKCHTSSKTAGKCPKCGVAMKKHTMKVMG